MNSDDPYDDEATRAYYDRKVARAEEVAMPVVAVTIIVCTCALVLYSICRGIEMLMR
jgi:hypothetical protein